MDGRGCKVKGHLTLFYLADVRQVPKCAFLGALHLKIMNIRLLVSLGLSMVDAALSVGGAGGRLNQAEVSL